MSRSASKSKGGGWYIHVSTESTKTNSFSNSTHPSSVLSRDGSSTISVNSSEAEDRSIADTKDESEDGSMCAAFAAAAWTSRAAREAGRGREFARWGKFRMAAEPLMLRAATSCALAAISGVGNVPSHIRDFFRGSRISDTHFPQFRIRTPRYTGCLLESRMRFIFLLSRPASVSNDIVFSAETLILYCRRKLNYHYVVLSTGMMEFSCLFLDEEEEQKEVEEEAILIWHASEIHQLRLFFPLFSLSLLLSDSYNTYKGSQRRKGWTHLRKTRHAHCNRIVNTNTFFTRHCHATSC